MSKLTPLTEQDQAQLLSLDVKAHIQTYEAHLVFLTIFSTVLVLCGRTVKEKKTEKRRTGPIISDRLPWRRSLTWRMLLSISNPLGGSPFSILKLIVFSFSSHMFCSILIQGEVSAGARKLA